MTVFNMKGLLFCFFALIVSGCDSTQEAVENNTSEKNKSTALYFPDGTGIDFKRLPLKDFTEKNSKGMVYRTVVYEFDESTSEIESSLWSVLRDQGYKRKIRAESEFLLTVLYRKKPNHTVFVKSDSGPKEGFSKKTIVTLQWIN